MQVWHRLQWWARNGFIWLHFLEGRRWRMEHTYNNNLRLFLYTIYVLLRRSPTRKKQEWTTYSKMNNASRLCGRWLDSTPNDHENQKIDSISKNTPFEGRPICGINDPINITQKNKCNLQIGLCISTMRKTRRKSSQQVQKGRYERTKSFSRKTW